MPGDGELKEFSGNEDGWILVGGLVFWLVNLKVAVFDGLCMLLLANLE